MHQAINKQLAHNVQQDNTVMEKIQLQVKHVNQVFIVQQVQLILINTHVQQVPSNHLQLKINYQIVKNVHWVTTVSWLDVLRQQLQFSLDTMEVVKLDIYFQIHMLVQNTLTALRHQLLQLAVQMDYGLHGSDQPSSLIALPAQEGTTVPLLP